MWKFILFGLIILLAVYIFKRVMADAEPAQSDTPKSEDGDAENMVQCATCHVHLPRSDAFLVNGTFYCSKGHIQDQ